MGQRVKDTLCGTKVLRRADYEKIARGRAYFGEFDPFGDFDLLLGAARLNLKIVDLPVRYQPRTYGDDEHQPLAARPAPVAHDRLRVLEVPRRGRFARSATSAARGRRGSETRGAARAA